MHDNSSVAAIKNTRRNLLLALVGAIALVNGLVTASSYDEMALVASADLARTLTIASAAALSLIVIVRQGITGIFGRAYLFLFIGILLWLLAEATWAYYELGLAIERPFPSTADAFWLAGYGPLGYHLFSMSRFYGRGTKKLRTILVGISVAVFTGLYMFALSNVSELGEGPDALIGFAISTSYPVLDAILLIPAILIVMNAGRGMLTSIPWIFLSLIFLWLADTILGFTAVQNFDGDIIFVNSWYTIAYLTMAAGLWWYNRFFIFDKARYRSSSRQI